MCGLLEVEPTFYVKMFFTGYCIPAVVVLEVLLSSQVVDVCHIAIAHAPSRLAFFWGGGSMLVREACFNFVSAVKTNLH